MKGYVRIGVCAFVVATMLLGVFMGGLDGDVVYEKTSTNIGMYRLYHILTRGTANLTNPQVAALDSSTVYYADTWLNFTVTYQDTDNGTITSLNFTYNDGGSNHTVNVDITNNNTGKNYTVGVTFWIHYRFAAGDYTWWFNASNEHGDLIQNTSETPLTILNKDPVLVNGSVTPLSGTTSTGFTFNVTYYDIDNEAPTGGKVWVKLSNGSTISVNLSDNGGTGAFNDGNFANGENLQAQITVGDIGIGDFIFRFNVTNENTSASVYSQWYKGGYVNISFSDFRVIGNASIPGNQSNEKYNLSVNLYHTSGNLPLNNTVMVSINGAPKTNMYENDSADTDTTDGKEYRLDNITLIEGKNTFVFNASVATTPGYYDNYTSWEFYFWVNRPPIVSYAQIETTPGAQTQIPEPTANDPDGDTLTYTLQSSEIPGVTINPNNGSGNFIAPTQKGYYNITVEVNDNNGSVVQATITVRVKSTERPNVTATDPEDKATDIPVNTTIQVFFDKDMDANTFVASGSQYDTVIVGYADNPQNVVPINLEYNNKVLYISSASGTWYYGKNVVVTLLCLISNPTYGDIPLITDVDGNPLYPWYYYPDPQSGSTIFFIMFDFWTHHFDIVSTYPAPTATDVEVDTTIEVEFNHTVDQSTVNKDTFIVKDSNNNAVNGTFSFPSGNRIIFTPENTLSYGETYTVTITTGLLDETGASLDVNGDGIAEDYSWTFTTKSEFLNISSVSPEDGAIEVSRNPTITITFNKDIDTTDIYSMFELMEKYGNDVNITVSANGNTVTISPNETLEWETTYVVTVSGEIVAADGAPFDKDGILSNGPQSEDYTFEFTTVTKPVTVEYTNPNNYAKDISITPQITIKFSRALNSTTVNNETITLTDKDGYIVAINVTYNPMTFIVTIEPQSPLRYETNYTVTVTPGILDENGKVLDGNGDGNSGDPYIFYFVTVETPLNITEVYPEDGAVNVTIDTQIWFKFNRAINESTLNGSIRINGQVINMDNISYDNTEYKVTIDIGILEYDTEYTISIGAGITSATSSNNVLGDTFTWSFRTEVAPPTTGAITGQIIDETGNPVSGALIIVYDIDGKEVGTATTDENGNFTITGLKPGIYSINITMSGYKTKTITNIEVIAGEVVSIPGGTITLEKEEAKDEEQPSGKKPGEDKGLFDLGRIAGIDVAYIIIAIIVLVIIIAVAVVVIKRKKREEVAPEAYPPEEAAPMAEEGIAPEAYPEGTMAPPTEGAIPEGVEGEVLPEEELFAPVPGQPVEEAPAAAEAGVPSEGEVSGMEEAFAPPAPPEAEAGEEDLFADLFEEEEPTPKPEVTPAVEEGGEEEFDLFDLDEGEGVEQEKKEGGDELEDLFGDL